MAVSGGDLRRDLEELVAALDRRTPQRDRTDEAGIARDAADLRSTAIDRLRELAHVDAAGARRPVFASRVGKPTPLPNTPSDVVALTAAEFTRDLDLTATMSFDALCQRFVDDANRAVVWFIRFRALTVWSERPDIVAWLRSQPRHAGRAGEVAASFALNADWEFDADAFRSTIESTFSL